MPIFSINLINQILVILIVIIDLWLGFWVYLSNRKAKVNQLFLLMAIFLFLWIIFCFLGNAATQLDFAIFLAKLAYGATSLFLIYFYLFFIHFLGEENKFPKLNKFILIACIFVFIIVLFTNLMVKSMAFTGRGAIPILGNGQFFHFGLTFFITFFIISRLLLKYFKIPKEEKLKIQYFLIGILILIFANLIFNVILATIQGMPLYYDLGNYSAIFFLGFTAFAIVKRELFGIKVILTQFLVGVVAILLLVQAVTAENWVEFAWKFTLFALFLVFGYLLIRSVIQEIQRRAELQRLYNEVDKLSRAKSEFLSIASHQLRTPLTVIKGYISMVLEGTYGKFEDKGKPPLEKVFQSNERLINLVNDLLNISRIESGTLKLDLEKVSLEKMVSSVLDEMKIKADERKLYLNWEKITPLPQIMADPGKLRQVVLNIIDNSIKYTDQGGITIKSETKVPSRKYEQGLILLTIKDTGEGMTKDEINKMFESFTRGEAGEKHDTSGLGLGLYIAKKFSELHGGRVWAESEGKGKGSTFYIELPVK